MYSVLVHAFLSKRSCIGALRKSAQNVNTPSMVHQATRKPRPQGDVISALARSLMVSSGASWPLSENAFQGYQRNRAHTPRTRERTEHRSISRSGWVSAAMATVRPDQMKICASLRGARGAGGGGGAQLVCRHWRLFTIHVSYLEFFTHSCSSLDFVSHQVSRPDCCQPLKAWKRT